MIPQNAELTKRPKEIQAWDEVDPKMKPVLARQMEVYAGFLEHTDHHIGRLFDTLKDLDILNDTLIYVIIGDNGASAEGTPNGTFNELLTLNGIHRRRDSRVPGGSTLTSSADRRPITITLWAGRTPWTHPINGPSRWRRTGAARATVPSCTGQTESRPRARFVRSSASVIDVAPTVLEVAGIPEPTIVNSVLQAPMEGVSMAYSFDDARAAERHDLQYFEMLCNRGIYHRGWSAVTRHSTPWVMMAKLPAFDDDVWELYDGSKDWTQAHDLAKQMPEKLHELQRLWLIEATKYNVLPLDDRRVERLNPDLAGRPQLIKGNSQLLFSGMGRLSENCVVAMKNKSFSITAEVEVPATGAEGVIFAQGGAFGGLSLYTKNGKLKFAYNFFGLQTFTIEAGRPIPPGKHQVRMEFAYDGGGFGKGGNVSLFYDGKKVGEGRVEQHRSNALLGRRNRECWPRYWHACQCGLHPRYQHVHRQGELGPDRRRQGCSGPVHQCGRAPEPRHGTAMSAVI